MDMHKRGLSTTGLVVSVVVVVIGGLWFTFAGDLGSCSVGYALEVFDNRGYECRRIRR